jgi:HSP20 family protein
VLNDLLKDYKAPSSNKVDFVPKANILENEKEFEIQLELAGFNKKDVNLNLDKDLLTIAGSRKIAENKEKVNVHLHQIVEGSFERSFYLPENIAENKISAKLENGVLIVRIPKDEKKAVKKAVNID